MGALEILQDQSAHWKRMTPAETESIRRLVLQFDVELPEDYLALLHYSNGGEGTLAIEPWWFQIWPAERVVEFNSSYQVERNVPGLLGFGSNGGGEMLAFDTRQGEPWKVVMVPFVPLVIEDAIIIADSFLAFVKAMGHEANHDSNVES